MALLLRGQWAASLNGSIGGRVDLDCHGSSITMALDCHLNTLSRGCIDVGPVLVLNLPLCILLRGDLLVHKVVCEAYDGHPACTTAMINVTALLDVGYFVLHGCCRSNTS